jgi:energy-converting hydrogenase Eha subunit E
MEEYREYIGYLASAIVLLSFVMGRILYLRIINTIGCCFFIFYGALLGSIPIIATNAAIVLINLYYLVKMQKSESDLPMEEA